MEKSAAQFVEVGFVKYTGARAASGVIDAGSAGLALVGLNEAIRYFNIQQSSDFADIDYDVPVETRAGSWEAVLLAGAAVGSTFALSYAKKAGEKMAENDFKEIGLKHVLSKSMHALFSLFKIIKVTSSPRGWEQARIEPTLDSATAIVRGEGGTVEIPVEYFRWYQRIPPRILSKMAAVVRNDRIMTVGYRDGESVQAISINEEEKDLFDDLSVEDVEEEILFPELEHGSSAALDGRLIRGSEASNSLGLEYMGHVINCVPALGSVRQYKPALFLHCRIIGSVNRHTKNRFVADRRPTIIINTVIPLESDSQGSLF